VFNAVDARKEGAAMFPWGLLGLGHWPGALGFIALFSRLFFLAAVIVGIVLIVQAVSRRGAGGSGHDSARETLRRRYAGGEISREEFEQKMRDLS
jgi:putative membrane protein